MGELLRTMNESDRKEMESLAILTTPEKSQLVENSRGRIVNQRMESRSTTNEDVLNLNYGFAVEVVDKIVGHVDIERAQASN